MSNIVITKNPLNIDIDVNVKFETLAEVAEYKYMEPFVEDKEYTEVEAYFQTQNNPTQLLPIVDGKIINYTYQK